MTYSNQMTGKTPTFAAPCVPGYVLPESDNATLHVNGCLPSDALLTDKGFAVTARAYPAGVVLRFDAGR